MKCRRRDLGGRTNDGRERTNQPLPHAQERLVGCVGSVRRGSEHQQVQPKLWSVAQGQQRQTILILLGLKHKVGACERSS